jgi:hypothetical protein
MGRRHPATQPDDIFAGIGGAAFLLLALTFASVGAIVARRVPDNRIGWVFCVTGLLTFVHLVTWQYADVDLNTVHHLPGSTAAVVINNVMGEEIAGWFGLALLLFPDGRLPSRRWRPVLAGLIVGMALLVTAGTLTPGRYDEPFAAVSNPLGVPGARGAMDAVHMAGWILVFAGIVAGTAALVVRLRRAHAVVRQQLKLVLAVGSVAATVTALDMSTWFIWPHGGLPARIAVLGFAFAAFPLAAGFAILRRGLYGIDVVINRTLVYGSVTAVLAAAFAATVLLLGTALGRGSPWTTAVATLVVAIAFRPVRARVQDAVDRRFNRARYDALHRMTGFFDDLRAGRAAPEGVEALLRELVSDPTLELHFFLPESQLYVDAHGMPVAAAPDDRRECVPIERGGQPLGQVLHRRNKPGHAAPPAARRGRRAGNRDRPPRVELRRRRPRCGPRGPNSRCCGCGAQADRTRPARRRPAALRLDRARPAARPTRPRTRRAGGVAGAGGGGRGDHPRDRRAARAGARAAAGAARRRPRVRAAGSRGGHRSRSRCGRPARGPIPTSRRPRTSPPAKVSRTR